MTAPSRIIGNPPNREPVRPPARQVLDKAMSEDELLQAIVEAALFLGWRVHHDRRSDKALQQGSPGFPDLVLIRDGEVKFWELKSEAGQLTAEQNAWKREIEAAEMFDGADYRIVRPSDLDAALRELA